MRARRNYGRSALNPLCAVPSHQRRRLTSQLEDEVAEPRWSSGRGRAKTPALVVAAFRHFDNRGGFPLLHDHCLVLNSVQRLDDDGEPVVGSHF